MEKFDFSLDKSNMLSAINALPNQFSQALNETKTKISCKTRNIIFCAMGGSALPCNLLKTFLSAAKIPCDIRLKISRDYFLPAIVEKRWCGFFSSYSGNTQETLSALKHGQELRLKQIILLANGGKLAEIAQENNLPFIQIPNTNQPRLSYGYVLGSLLKILNDSKLIKVNIDELKADADKLNSSIDEIDLKARELAQALKNFIPLFYASNVWKYLGMVAKINFNENAKTQSFWNALPEMNHNEMVGFTNLLAKYKIVFIKDKQDNLETLKRMDILSGILKDKIDCLAIEMPDGSALYKMLYTLQLCLLASYYLALLYGIDPAPVTMVEKFKQSLVQNPESKVLDLSFKS